MGFPLPGHPAPGLPGRGPPRGHPGGGGGFPGGGGGGGFPGGPHILGIPQAGGHQLSDKLVGNPPFMNNGDPARVEEFLAAWKLYQKVN